MIHLTEKRYEVKNSEKAITGILSSEKLSHLGTGVSAIAYEHKKHSNTVIKTIQLVGKHDSIFAFIRLCFNHSGNSFFPKVYAAKVYDIKEMDQEKREELYSLIDPTDTPPDPGKYVMLVVMEKLIAIQQSSITRAIATELLQKYKIIPSDESQIRANIYGVKDPLSMTVISFAGEQDRKKLRDVNIQAHQQLNPEYRKWLKTNNTQSFKQLHQALKLLEPVFKVSDADMHQRNIMLRKLSDGQHELVFVDPVCS